MWIGFLVGIIFGGLFGAVMVAALLSEPVEQQRIENMKRRTKQTEDKQDE